MAPDTVSQANNPPALSLRWTRRVSLTWRILAVNIFAIAMLGGGLLYLDSYREQIIQERLDQERQSIWLLAHALERLDQPDRIAMMIAVSRRYASRVRLYDSTGTLQMDSFVLAPPTYALRDPANEPWQRHAARLLDQGFDGLVNAQRIDKYVERQPDQLQNWPEAVEARDTARTQARMRYAPDRTPMISAAIALPRGSGVLFTSYNARDITRIVRAERTNLALIVLTTALVSILFSLFLARTIVKPLRRLASAAVRVRLGRAREVVVPRLPSRGDEIGLLARSLSDMSLALRQKIDATEAFAADVSHELKNPLASLRSALEGLGSVKDEALRAQLFDIACSDVRRLDRLITDISEASRVDAQLTRTRFEPIDLGEMIENLLEVRRARGLNDDREIVFARPRRGVAVVMGEGTRLERVISNLLDNAVSFSPPGGLVRIEATQVRTDEQWRVLVRVIDEGPGVLPSEREEIFRRFHSARPEGEAFGQHSGLGLAIARTIIEGHHGTISADDRDDGEPGACFDISLPGIDPDGLPISPA
ncbi:sensor histidine kinase [Blastomonas aquatica]|uniref:histidine kinase n=1 Tax=Blastomonas aquatica TaxID=1510276 RepID=A0ABQ1JCC5_9SPHN|nr:ATP-binding protein [Blastomonas aquatica]GGB63821.1 histidine kinase [Blastomonas aquatica]